MHCYLPLDHQHNLPVCLAVLNSAIRQPTPFLLCFHLWSRFPSQHVVLLISQIRGFDRPSKRMAVMYYSKDSKMESLNWNSKALAPAARHPPSLSSTASKIWCRFVIYKLCSWLSLIHRVDISFTDCLISVFSFTSLRCWGLRKCSDVSWLRVVSLVNLLPPF